MPSNHFILCHSFLLLLSIFSSIRVFSNELALCIMWPKYWSFSLSASPSNGYSGLISFRIDCFDLLAVVQGTLKNLLQHHSLKASILWHSAFSVVQLSQFSSVQWLSQVWLFATPWTAAHQNPLSINNSLEPTQTHVHRVGDAIQPSHPLRPLILLPSIFRSIRVLSNESVLPMRWPKYWSFSFSISPSNEYSGLISFRMDSLDLLAVQGTLKSLLQHHSSKASVLQCSAFFIFQLSHPYITTGKTIALTRWTFVGKVRSLLFNMLSRLVIAFLPRSKHLLISWLKSPSAVILEPPQIKSLSVSTVSPFICHEVMGPDAMILVFWMLSCKPTFSLSSFTFIKRLLGSSLSTTRVVSSAYLRYWYLSQQSWFQLVLHPAQRFSWCTLHISWISRVTI